MIGEANRFNLNINRLKVISKMGMYMNQNAPRICIIGAGMSGMLMAIKLKKRGIHDVVIYEKSIKVGGTWRENRYPGVACDVASFSYCYAFEPNPDWSRRFSPGPEIQRYFERTAEKYGLLPHIRFSTTVTRAVFRDHQWYIETDKGEQEIFDLVVAATGPLRERKYPDIAGLQDFAGDCFHTADWNDALDLRDKRVGVIGTGSSSVQMIAPLSEQAAQVTIFQRTAQWVMPTPNPYYSDFARWSKRKIPLLGWMTRKFYDWVGEQFGRAALYDGWRRRLVGWACRNHLASIKDPVLREKLTPSDEPMCKRMIVSDTFYEAMQKPHVHLVTDNIERIVPEGIKTKDGKVHPLDVLVLATGFYPNVWGVADTTGIDGKKLDDVWRQGIRTYRSMSVPGFPNYFFLIGPNSPITNLSLIDIADIGVDYVMQAVDDIAAGKYKSLAPKADVVADFTEAMKAAFSETVWVSGCNSWYLDADGVPATWPWLPSRFREELKTLDLSDYDVYR